MSPEQIMIMFHLLSFLLAFYQCTSLLVWSEGEVSSGEEGEPAASRDNWSSLARLKIFS